MNSDMPADPFLDPAPDESGASYYDSASGQSFEEWCKGVERITHVAVSVDKDPNHAPDPNREPATFRFLMREATDANAGFMRMVMSDDERKPFAHYFIVRGETAIAEMFAVIEETVDRADWLMHGTVLQADTPMADTMKMMRFVDENGDQEMVALGLIEEDDQLFLAGIIVDDAVLELGHRMDLVADSWA